MTYQKKKRKSKSKWLLQLSLSDFGPVIFVHVGLSPLSSICNCDNSFDIWGVPIEEIALYCRVCEVLYCVVWTVNYYRGILPTSICNGGKKKILTTTKGRPMSSNKFCYKQWAAEFSSLLTQLKVQISKDLQRSKTLLIRVWIGQAACMHPSLMAFKTIFSITLHNNPLNIFSLCQLLRPQNRSYFSCTSSHIS